MLLRKDREERFGEKRDGFELMATNGNSEQSDINCAGSQPVEKHRCDLLNDPQARLWKLPGKGRKQLELRGAFWFLQFDGNRNGAKLYGLPRFVLQAGGGGFLWGACHTP